MSKDDSSALFFLLYHLYLVSQGTTTNETYKWASINKLYNSLIKAHENFLKQPVEVRERLLLTSAVANNSAASITSVSSNNDNNKQPPPPKVITEITCFDDDSENENEKIVVEQQQQQQQQQKYSIVPAMIVTDEGNEDGTENNSWEIIEKDEAQQQMPQSMSVEPPLGLTSSSAPTVFTDVNNNGNISVDSGASTSQRIFPMKRNCMCIRNRNIHRLPLLLVHGESLPTKGLVLLLILHCETRCCLRLHV